MSIDAGLRAVDAVISSPNWDIAGLMRAAADRAMQELQTKPGLPQGYAFGIDNACRTYYGATSSAVNQEIVAWFLSILLAEYTAGLLAKKVIEGHCNVHRQPPAYQPCPHMPQEHLAMLKAFRDRLKQLVTDVETLVQQTQPPSPPAAATPTSSGS